MQSEPIPRVCRIWGEWRLCAHGKQRQSPQVQRTINIGADFPLTSYHYHHPHPTACPPVLLAVFKATFANTRVSHSHGVDKVDMTDRSRAELGPLPGMRLSIRSFAHNNMNPRLLTVFSSPSSSNVFLFSCATVATHSFAHGPVESSFGRAMQGKTQDVVHSVINSSKTYKIAQGSD